MCVSSFFFFNDTATTEIYTLSLHDALPILDGHPGRVVDVAASRQRRWVRLVLLEDLDERAFRPGPVQQRRRVRDRKSTRLNSSHANISYAVFCLKKKNHD